MVLAGERCAITPVPSLKEPGVVVVIGASVLTNLKSKTFPFSKYIESCVNSSGQMGMGYIWACIHGEVELTEVGF